MSAIGARICSPSAEACHVTQTHFLVRAGKSRRVQESEEEITYSLDRARSWPSQGSRVLELPARHGHPGRSAQLQLSFGQLTLLPPRARATRKQGAIDRVGHSRLGRAGSPRGEEPLEWLLLTSVPTTMLEQAWERVDWYQYRWLVEIVQPQMTKTKLLTGRGGGDHRADLHFLVGHNDAINQQLDQVPFLLKGGLSKSLLYPLAKGFHRLYHTCQCIVSSDTDFQLACLFSNAELSLFQFEPAPLVFFQRKHSSQIGVGQSFCLLSQADTSGCRIFTRRACNS
jgi:hypothetical protein